MDAFLNETNYEADGTAKPLTYQPSVLKRALGHGQKILNGEGKYADISYSATSLAALQEAVTEGQSYYDTVKGKFISSQEKGAEIKEQADLVEDAIAALEVIGGVDKSLLRAAITEAEEIEADKYSEASYAALQAALEAAKAVEANGDATQSQVDKQLELLQAAIKALITNVDLKEGQYKIPVRLQQAMTTADSMGNESLNQEAILTVADGKAKLQMEFKPMKFSGFTGYLGYLKAIDESSIAYNESNYPIAYDFLDNMSVTQWFTANDLYNTPSEIAALVAAAEASGDEGDIKRAKKIAVCYDDLLAYNTAMGNSSVQYPQLYEMSVDVNNLDSEMWVEVYASVMGELTSAQQVARLMIDWTPYTEESVDTSELAAAQKTAEEMTQDTASNESWQALQKAIAAATELLKPETKKSQVQVDAQLALLNAAIAAVKAEQGLSTDALDSAIAEAEELLTDDAYTDVSLAALQAVKEAAAAISADTSNEVAQADINAAVAAVKTAMDALVLKSSQKEVAVGETVPVTLQNENGGIATASSVLQNEAEIVAVDEEAGMATLQLNFQTITIGSTTAGSLGWVTTGSAYGYTFTETKYSDSVICIMMLNEQWQYYTESAKVEVPIGCGEIPVIMHMPKLSSVVKDQDNTQNYVIAVDWSNYLAASDAALDVLSEAVADVQQVLNAYQTIENSGLEAVSDKVWDALAAVQKAGVALGGDANRATNDDAVTKTEATSAADQDAYDTAEALCAVLQLVRVKAADYQRRGL